jgi:hypothetical protein
MEFKNMIIAHATGAQTYSAHELAKAGIASGLSESIQVWLIFAPTPKPAWQVLHWLLYSTDFSPEPAKGDKYYRVVYGNAVEFVQAGDWLDAFICIRFRKMTDRAPSLARLVEACAWLEPQQRNLLLGAPTSERFPMSEIQEIFGDDLPHAQGVASKYNGTEPVLRSFSPKEMIFHILAPAFRLSVNSDGLELNDSENQYKFKLDRIPPAILAAVAWRELHWPS